MTEGKELAVRALDLATLTGMGKVFYESGMFQDMKSAAQCVVKIQAGSELGFPPIYAMTKIYIVKGRVMVGAEALGAMVKRSGQYDYRVVKLTDTECELMFTDKGKDAYLSHFTLEDAKRADLIQPGGGWNKWPRAMLMSKALSQGARIVCPHIIAGAYTAADFGYAEDDEGNIQEPVSEITKPKEKTGKTEYEKDEEIFLAPPENTTSSPPGLARDEVKAETSSEIPAPDKRPPTNLSVNMIEYEAFAKTAHWRIPTIISYLKSIGLRAEGKTHTEIMSCLTPEQQTKLFERVKLQAESK